MATSSIYGSTTASVAANNISNMTSPVAVACITEEPTAQQFLTTLSSAQIVILTVLCFFALLSLIIYIEEIVFIIRNFDTQTRRNKSIWILAYFPVFSITALLAVIVPRSGTIVDCVANTFFATALYQFLGLIVNYLGGREKTLNLVSQSRDFSINTFPLCCCLVCLPKLTLSKRKFFTLQLLIVQFIVVRPLVNFVAAILWANGSYVAGSVSPSGPYLYLALINLCSTLTTMYALMIVKGCFSAELEKPFILTYKVACMQASLIFTMLPRLILAIMVILGAIECSSFLPTKSRADVIYHGLLVVLMAIFGLIARFTFRRPQDGFDIDTENGFVTLTSFKEPSKFPSPSYTLPIAQDTANGTIKSYVIT